MELSVVNFAVSIDRITPIEQHVKYIHQSFDMEQRKVIDIEDRSRRSNLIIHGIPEDEKESEKTLRDKVIIDIFQKILALQTSSVARIHRPGKTTSKERADISFVYRFM